MKKALSLFSVVSAGIMFVSAQNPVVVNSNSLDPVKNLLTQFQNLVNSAVPVLISVAVVVFFWYLIKLIIKGNESADAKDVALKGMGYSIMAIFIMVSIWGIIALAGNMLGIKSGGSTAIPCPPGHYQVGDPCFTN